MVVEMVRKGQILGILEWTASHEDDLTGLIVLEMGLGLSLLLWVSGLALFLSQSNLSGHPGGCSLQYFQNHFSLQPR